MIKFEELDFCYADKVIVEDNKAVIYLDKNSLGDNWNGFIYELNDYFTNEIIDDFHTVIRFSGAVSFDDATVIRELSSKVYRVILDKPNEPIDELGDIENIVYE